MTYSRRCGAPAVRSVVVHESQITNHEHTASFLLLVWAVNALQLATRIRHAVPSTMSYESALSVTSKPDLVMSNARQLRRQPAFVAAESSNFSQLSLIIHIQTERSLSRVTLGHGINRLLDRDFRSPPDEPEQRNMRLVLGLHAKRKTTPHKLDSAHVSHTLGTNDS